ncbi:MAG TPA: TIGR02757 family protein [Cyclobacteriaceae bacterium]
MLVQLKYRPSRDELKDFLDAKADHYNTPSFIENDPVSIPHQFTLKQDIEIAGLFAAILAWGKRITIIRKCNDLLERMDHDPYAFVTQHNTGELKSLLGFKHRTFNDTDLLYFVSFLKWYYRQHDSLETIFAGGTIEEGLIRFQQLFFSLEDHPQRTRKHISTPAKKSTCKRLCMFLRWMVRRDGRGVDFGLWNTIPQADLICPCDVHVDRVARRLKLIKRKRTDWETAVELTSRLRLLDPHDPVKYDFALFGLGVMENWS